MVSYSDKTISGRIKELSGEYTVRKIDVKRYSSNQHLAVEMGVFGFFIFYFVRSSFVTNPFRSF